MPSTDSVSVPEGIPGPADLHDLHDHERLPSRHLFARRAPRRRGPPVAPELETHALRTVTVVRAPRSPVATNGSSGPLVMNRSSVRLRQAAPTRIPPDLRRQHFAGLGRCDQVHRCGPRCQGRVGCSSCERLIGLLLVPMRRTRPRALRCEGRAQRGPLPLSRGANRSTSASSPSTSSTPRPLLIFLLVIVMLMMPVRRGVGARAAAAGLDAVASRSGVRLGGRRRCRKTAT